MSTSRAGRLIRVEHAVSEAAAAIREERERNVRLAARVDAFYAYAALLADAPESAQKADMLRRAARLEEIWERARQRRREALAAIGTGAVPGAGPGTRRETKSG